MIIYEQIQRTRKEILLCIKSAISLLSYQDQLYGSKKRVYYHMYKKCFLFTQISYTNFCSISSFFQSFGHLVH